MSAVQQQKPRAEIKGLTLVQREAMDLMSIEEAIMGLEPDVAHVYATTRGCAVRVVQRQGCPCIVTRDHRPFRHNVAVIDGVITEVLGRG